MKKAIMILLVIALTFNLTGCWSHHELNDYAVVVGVGIDKAKTSGNVLLTVQIVKPDELAKGSMGGKGGKGGNSGKAYWNMTSEGQTVFSAAREYTHESSRKLYMQHNKVIIFSREIAEEGLQNYLDFFVRDHETRATVELLISDTDRASDILDVKPELEKIPSLGIDKSVAIQTQNAETYSINLLSFLHRLTSKTMAPVAPLVYISGEGEDKKIRMSGAAVFKKDKLVGELNQLETRGLLWVDDKVKSGVITVGCPGGDGKVDLEITESHGTFTPEIKDGIITIKIKIKEKSNLGSQSSTEDLATTPMLKILNEESASAIRDEIMASVEKARILKADIFGFGEAIHRKYPGQWKELESNWDEVFPNIQVEIQVDTEIYGTGEVAKPVNSED